MLPDLPAISLADLGYSWTDVPLWLGVAIGTLVAIAVLARKSRSPWRT